MRRLRPAVCGGGVIAVDLGTAYGRIVINGAGATSGVATAQKALLGFGTSAALVGAGLAAAFTVGVVQSVRVAAEFEQAMADLRAVSGATGDQLERLSEQALKAGASTRFSATEAAGAQLELAKAGVTLADIQGGALDGALSLAAAGNLEVADAATIAANAMNLFGLRGEDVTGIADALATAANVTTADVGDFGMALTQGGAAAKLAGLDFQQTTVFLEALAAAGVKNSDAGTSLKASLIQLLNPTAKQAAEAERLGLSFIGANGRMKDAATLSADLRRATEGMTKAERARTFAILGGSDGLRTLNALFDAGPKRLRAYARGLDEQGTAAKVAADRQDSLQGVLEEFGGAIETAQIRLGSGLLPLLAEAATGLTALVNAGTGSGQLADFGEGLAEGIRTGADAVRELGPLAQQAGPILADLFNITRTAAEGAAPVIGTVATGVLTLAGAALSLVGPIVSVVDALVSLPGVAQGSAAGLVGLAAAFVILSSAAKVTAILGAVSAFGSLAGSVRSAGAAATLAGAAFPSLAAGLATLTGPVGIAAVGIGLATAAVLALTSGMFRGASPAEVLAGAMRNVTAAMNEAAGAVRNMDAATNKIADTQLRAADAGLRVKEAEAGLASLRASGTATPLQLARAELTLRQARVDAARASRDAAGAQTEASRTARAGVAALVNLATTQGTASEKARAAADVARNLGQRFGVSGDEAKALTAQLGRLTSGGANTAARLGALQDAANKAAAGIKGTGPAAQRAKAELEAIGKASPGQLAKFVGDIKAGTAKGQSNAEAGRAAIDALLASTGNVTVPMSSFVASIDSGMARAEAIARQRAANIRAAMRSANADERQSPSANDVLRASLQNTEKATRAGLRKVLHATTSGVSDILAAEQHLADALTALDARNEARDRAAERRRLRRAVGSAQAKVADADTPDERKSADQALNQARAAVRQFEAEERRRRQRLPVEAARDAAQAVAGALSGVESSVAAVGQSLGDAIDRGLQSAIAATEANLRASLDAIANGPEAARIAAIGTEVEGLRAGRAARDTARQGAALDKTAGEASALVERRRAALARARTGSEQAAAQALLDKALADEATARGALADFAEDQRIAALEAERTGLEATLQARRDAATRAAEDQRAALEAQAAAQRASLALQLGDLTESLRAGEITYRQFTKRLGKIAGDPALADDLAASGRALGLSFTRGLERSIAGAEGAAEAMAKAIARYLKLRSPAEAGPLRYDFAKAGRIIGTDLAGGMADRRRTVALEAQRLASAASLAGARVGGGDRGAAPAAWASGGNTYNVTIPAERPVENPRAAAERMAWELRHGSV